ncbi:hypothetical protein AVM03_19280 (plasmid) [Bacillus amyloliquefaciens]|nr:hypothetical protein AVM03_19280 [Bacillus amyloliquefaciens]
MTNKVRGHFLRLEMFLYSIKIRKNPISTPSKSQKKAGKIAGLFLKPKTQDQNQSPPVGEIFFENRLFSCEKAFLTSKSAFFKTHVRDSVTNLFLFRSNQFEKVNLAKYFKALPRKKPLTLHSSKAYQKIFKLLKMVHWAKITRRTLKSLLFLFSNALNVSIFDFKSTPFPSGRFFY